ncbi:MAG: VUT family protein [Burkholderiales bacterium]|nr:VUT family protein [Burkholderiales bacterium]
MSEFTQNSRRYLFYVTAIYFVLWVVIAMLLDVTVMINNFIINGAGLLIPFWFFIGNIISEVYGYLYFKKIIMKACVFQVIIGLCGVFILLFLEIQHVSFTTNINFSNQLKLFDYLFQLVFANLIAIIGSKSVSHYIIPRCKALLDKKYFTLRSNGISILGEMWFIVVVNFIGLINTYSIASITKIVIGAICIYLIFNILLAIPSNIIVNMLKQAEYIPSKIALQRSIFDIIKEKITFDHGIG